MSATLEQIAASLQQQQEQIAELVRRTPSGPILTLAEAIAYTKHASDSAFYRWAGRWRVASTSNGRYARGPLDRALHREATQRARANKTAA